MIELPGHTSTGCRDCHSINHQTYDCPYLEDGDRKWLQVPAMEGESTWHIHDWSTEPKTTH